MSKVISYNPSDCWKYFIPQHIFIFCSVQISINEKWTNQYIIRHTRLDVQLWKVLLVSLLSDCCQTRIYSYVY